MANLHNGSMPIFHLFYKPDIVSWPHFHKKTEHRNITLFMSYSFSHMDSLLRQEMPVREVSKEFGACFDSAALKSRSQNPARPV
jgi:hypothetical protein